MRIEFFSSLRIKLRIEMDNRLTESKIKLLQKTSLFSMLKIKELNEVAKYGIFSNYKKGEIIIKEGSWEKGLYIVEDGEVIITKNIDTGKEINLASFIPGEWFGEMDVLKNAPNSVNAIADKDTRMLVFPTNEEIIQNIFQEYPEITAKILHKLLAVFAKRIRSTNKLISDKSPWIRDLRRQLYSDQLTGLFNRSFLEEDLITLLPKYGENTSIIIIKPDNFKEVNDMFGHEAGDKTLRLMAIFVQSILRNEDIAVRYRGDEFAVVLPDTGGKVAFEIAEEIRSTLNEIDLRHITGNDDFRITVSIGIAVYPDNAVDSASIIKMAYETMFKARDSGGNRVLFVNSDKGFGA